MYGQAAQARCAALREQRETAHPGDHIREQVGPARPRPVDAPFAGLACATAPCVQAPRWLRQFSEPGCGSSVNPVAGDPGHDRLGRGNG